MYKWQAEYEKWDSHHCIGCLWPYQDLVAEIDKVVLLQFEHESFYNKISVYVFHIFVSWLRRYFLQSTYSRKLMWNISFVSQVRQGCSYYFLFIMCNYSTSKCATWQLFVKYNFRVNFVTVWNVISKSLSMNNQKRNICYWHYVKITFSYIQKCKSGEVCCIILPR